MDKLSPDERSRNMRLIRSRDTSPEIAVRSLVHSMGFRFRLHVRALPGCPDLVFPRLRKIIFVHGCFWHPHQSCKFGHIPKSNLEYWLPKLRCNQERDRANIRKLRRLGWHVLVVRECQVKDAARLKARLLRFLKS
ncbi:MAG: very short patch repair endonuclease [Bryobacteraceae bacterium]|nr:very short patch repair endonuclease [Bryobacteraceae bacterium]